MIFGLGVKENASEMNWIMDCPLLKLNKKIESTNVEINFSSLAFSARRGRNRDSLLSISSNWIFVFLKAYFREQRGPRRANFFFLLLISFHLNTYFCHDTNSNLYFSLLQPYSNPLTTGQKLILCSITPGYTLGEEKLGDLLNRTHIKVLVWNPRSPLCEQFIPKNF